MGMSERYPPEYMLEQLALYWGMIQKDGSRGLVLRLVGDRREIKAEL